MNPKWLDFAQRLQALAQSGLAFAKNPYDLERYEQIRELAAEMLTAYSEEEPERIANLFCGETGYATPKVDVRGVVFKDDAILLVRERQDGLWTIPGGWVDVGESPSEAVEKEVRQESGYIVRATRLLAVYDRNKHAHPPSAYHIYKLFFLCKLIGGEAATSIETEEVGFFREDEIPPLSVGKVTLSQIARMFEYLRQPDQPTDFD
jgi:ADP-ribose pyrophosphatase YjhB (NUDIX family)